MVQRVPGKFPASPEEPSPRGLARRLARRGAGVLLSAVLAAAGGAGEVGGAALGLLPDPPTITAAGAGDHLGDVVIVETLVGPASLVDGRVRLVSREPDATDFEIYVVPPIVGPSAREVAASLENRRVRAVGRVHEFGGRLQLVVVGQGEGRIVPIDGLESIVAPPTPVFTPAPLVEAPRSEVTPSEPPAAAGEVMPPPATSPLDERCANARANWDAARISAREPVAALDRCLGSGLSACRTESERARSALAELGAAAERMSWLCPGEGH